MVSTQKAFCHPNERPRVDKTKQEIARKNSVFVQPILRIFAGIQMTNEQRNEIQAQIKTNFHNYCFRGFTPVKR